MPSVSAPLFTPVSVGAGPVDPAWIGWFSRIDQKLNASYVLDVLLTQNTTINSPVGIPTAGDRSAPGPLPGDQLTVILQQDGVAGWAITWSAQFATWTSTTIAVAVGKFTVFHFVWRQADGLWYPVAPAVLQP